MSAGYPTTFEAIREWASANRILEAEARLRFAQYGVLRAVATSAELSRVLVFKGGNALDFVWQPNRSTTDLDFSIDTDALAVAPSLEWFRGALQHGLAASGRSLDIAFLLQSLRANPAGEGKTFVTWEGRIGFALRDEARLRALIANNQPVPRVIPVDVSLNEEICATDDVRLAGQYALRVNTIEDIIAEKLRALLQQPIRRRNRAQDLLDIAVCLRQRGDAGIDHARVAAFLVVKARSRAVPVSRAAFHAEELVRRTSQDYDALAATTRNTFIPLDEALDLLGAFVARLPIPET